MSSELVSGDSQAIFCKTRTLTAFACKAVHNDRIARPAFHKLGEEERTFSGGQVSLSCISQTERHGESESLR